MNDVLAAVDRLLTIPAVGRTVARVIVAEIGFDMSRFPTAGHLVSWAGLCPRQQESAGKRLSTRTRPGNPWLKTTLVQVAWVAARMRNYILKDDVTYRELDADYFERRDRAQLTRRLIRRLEGLGLSVEVRPAA